MTQSAQSSNRPKYSVSSMFFHEYPLEKIFESVEAAGCTSMEFWIETPSYWMYNLPVEKLAELAEQYPKLQPLSVHVPVLDLNPCSANPDVARVTAEWSARAAETAAAIGADIVTIHPGRRTSKREPGEADNIRLNEYLAYLKKRYDILFKEYGENTPKFSIENMAGAVNAMLKTPDAAARVFYHKSAGKSEQYSCGSSYDYRDLIGTYTPVDMTDFRFTLDIAHALSISEENALGFADRFFDKIANVHVSGADESRIHFPPSQSESAERVLMHLAEMGYTGHLTLEIEDLNFKKRLSLEEKVSVISNEVEFLMGVFG